MPFLVLDDFDDAVLIEGFAGHIDTDVSFTSDSTEFAGGSVRLSGLAEGDIAAVSASGDISISDASVRFGGAIIGTTSGGTGGDDLVITLTGAANAASIEALIEALELTGGSEGVRNLKVTVTDAVGVTSDVRGAAFGPGMLVEASGEAINVIGFSSPAFVDIDGDGDQDLFVGASYLGPVFYRNDGSASEPSFTAVAPQDAPFAPYESYISHSSRSPAFVDIDGDGDQDAFIGGFYGGLYFFRNDGTASEPSFSERIVGEDNPFQLASVGLFAEPTFVDIDGDGDQDAFVGSQYSGVHFFRNEGDAENPAFTEVMGADNPFDGVAVVRPDIVFESYYQSTSNDVAFVDIDGDGDQDAFVGEIGGTVFFFRNDGSATSPNFVEVDAADNPLAHVREGGNASPTFVDIDGDGDEDAFVGFHGGSVRFYEAGPTPFAVNANFLVLNSEIEDIAFDGITHTDITHDTLGGLMVDRTIFAGAPRGFVDQSGDAPGVVDSPDVNIPLFVIGEDDDFNTFRSLEITVSTPTGVGFEAVGLHNAFSSFTFNAQFGDVLRELELTEIEGEFEGVSGQFFPTVTNGLGSSSIADLVVRSVTPVVDGANLPLGQDGLAYLNLSGNQTDADANDVDDILEAVFVNARDLDSPFLVTSEGIDALLLGGRVTLVADEADILVNGDSAAQRITLGSGSDTVFAGAGADYVMARAGDDFLVAGRGNDIGFGGAGNDRLNGDGGRDELYGGAGNDFVQGGGQSDTLGGGTGDDTVAGNAGDDVIFGGTGNDMVFGGSGNDTLYGGGGSDILHGGDGADVFVFLNDPDFVFDTIRDFTQSEDLLDVSQLLNADGSPVTFDDITYAMTLIGGVDMSVGGGSIEIGGLHINLDGVSRLEESDFIFG